jgi:RND family efflux transporter MFP subunit
VESKSVVRVVALEDGRVLSVDAEDESPVVAGALLFTLGGDRIDSRLAAAKEKVASLQQRVSLAEETVKRKQDAVEHALAARDTFDAARATLAEDRAGLAEATQALRRMEDATQVRAPAAGTFTHRAVAAGQDVAAGDALGQVIAPQELRVVALCVPPAGADLEGRTANVHANGGLALSGTVKQVLPEKAANGETMVWIEGADIPVRLKPGEVVSGEIVLALHEGALAVPEAAIVRDEQETAHVFVQEDGSYRERKVTTGLVSDGWVEIVSGLGPDEKVVTSGAYELANRDFTKTFKVPD